MRYTIKDAVECGEWAHYTDEKTGNLCWENLHKVTWRGIVRRVWCFIRSWKD